MTQQLCSVWFFIRTNFEFASIISYEIFLSINIKCVLTKRVASRSNSSTKKTPLFYFFKKKTEKLDQTQFKKLKVFKKFDFFLFFFGYGEAAEFNKKSDIETEPDIEKNRRIRLEVHSEICNLKKSPV